MEEKLLREIRFLKAYAVDESGKVSYSLPEDSKKR